MRGSYFYKRTLISFSVFTFSLLTIILFFVNYRINVLYDYILEKSQKQLNAGVEIFEEDIEAEVFSYIEKVRERNQNDINHIPTETVFLNKTQLSNTRRRLPKYHLHKILWQWSHIVRCTALLFPELPLRKIYIFAPSGN